MVASRTRSLSVLTSALVLLLSTANAANAESLGTWTATTSYPSQLAGLGCAVVISYIYCVGGFDSNYNSYDDVYYASISGTGIGTWETGPVYPTAIDSTSCVSANSTVYCVGGDEDDGETVFNAVYYSEISPTTAEPGPWTAGATYPQAIYATSCVLYSGYIYCVGGLNFNGDDVSNTYYAQVSSSGIGSWTSTTAYPKAADSLACVVISDGYIYCVAGEIGSATPSSIDNVYYAQLSSSGIGKWSAGPAYPNSLAAVSCVSLGVAYSYIYCVGGFDTSGLSSSDAYYASITGPGVGTWTSTTPYPLAIDTSDCVVESSDIYCVGGVNSLSSGTENVNYAYFVAEQGVSVPVASTTSTIPEFPLLGAVPVILAGVLATAAVMLRDRRLET